MARPIDCQTLERFYLIERKLSEDLEHLGTSVVGMQGFSKQFSFPFFSTYSTHFAKEKSQTGKAQGPLYKLYLTIDCYLESTTPLATGDDMLERIELVLDEFYKKNRDKELLLHNCTVIKTYPTEIRDRYCLATVDLEIGFYAND